MVSRLEIDVDQLLVYADPGLLERALANVIDNALRHSRTSSPIRITAHLTAADPPRALIQDRITARNTCGGARQDLAAFQRLGDQNAGIGVGLGLAQGFVVTLCTVR